MKNRLTTLSQELFGKAKLIGMRLLVSNDWLLARWVPRGRIDEARRILADHKAGRLTDAEALKALEAIDEGT